MYHLCNNPNEWIQPRKFIPERFNPENKYYLTPSGSKRNAYSFSPFLGGSRVCIGKTFFEAVGKLAVPSLLSHFKFEFMDGVDPHDFKDLHNNVAVTTLPELDVYICDRNLTYTAK